MALDKKNKPDKIRHVEAVGIQDTFEIFMQMEKIKVLSNKENFKL